MLPVVLPVQEAREQGENTTESNWFTVLALKSFVHLLAEYYPVSNAVD